MDATEPCKICGCKETNLIDGFYYCVECGTQDTNVQETVVEDVFVGDGAAPLRATKRITVLPKASEVKMTDEWYNWHCLNFLLRGLADELIAVGAAPSFKTKLLWVWTRYMKKYINRADFGLANEDSDVNEESSSVHENDSSSDDEEIKKKVPPFEGDISKITMLLVISFLYVALNLDKSHIQLAHLLRLMREERISIMNWQHLVPKELRAKKLRKVLIYDLKAFRYSSLRVRMISLTLFRKLDLGNPIVPDLRLLIDEYMHELCLPNDLKPLIVSIIHHRSFHYLDINVKYKDLLRIPSYELYVMSHILMALKICFILDCDYEVQVSDAVDKINDLENYSKSYNSTPTKRLFSFRDWCSYIQFRKTLLRTHTLYLGAPNYFDMDDYVASEHQRVKVNYKIKLKDELSMSILNKVQSGDLNVIPRSEFFATMTPHSTYTRVVVEHLQDPHVKQLLCEDFTQYSLKYILEDIFLIDIDSPIPKNILTGLCERNYQTSGREYSFTKPLKGWARGQVYVKDCDNHNWTRTQPPNFDHVSATHKSNDSCEKDNDNGYGSDSEVAENVCKSNSDIENIQYRIGDTRESTLISTICSNNTVNTNTTNNNSLSDIEMETAKDETIDVENIQYLKITEEDDGKQIFDDNFLDMEIKKERENDPETIYNEPAELSESFHISNSFYGYNAQTQQYRQSGEESDVSSVDSIRFNPESLNRNDAIKELVIHACIKNKISIPGKYIQRQRKAIRRKRKPQVRRQHFPGDPKQRINDLISAYHSHIQHDILHQMSNMLQSAIANFNQNKEPSEEMLELEDVPRELENDEINNDTNGPSVENEQNNTNHESEQTAALDNDATVEEVDQYDLFGDSSDGETHAVDLLPKKNPEFDEETHDIRQLYIKQTESDSVPKMTLNSKLTKIIDQQIESEKNDPTLLECPRTSVKDSSDSEEEVSLTLLQEQKRIRKQLTLQEQNRKNNRLKYLIKNPVPPYKYWMRHYKLAYMGCRHYYERFAEDIDHIFPKSFVFVLKECSDIVGYPPFNVYKGMQEVEAFLKHKHVNRKSFVSCHVEHNKKNKTFEF